MVSYRDGQDNEVARVHQYLRLDDSLGADGRPDPKRLVYKGVKYRRAKGQNERAPDGLVARLRRAWFVVWGPIRCWLFER